MKKRPLAIRAAAAAVAVVALTAIAIPLLTTSAGASLWTPPTNPSTTTGTSGLNECPNIGDSTEGCAVLIILPASGPAQIVQNTNTNCGPSSNRDCNGPFDGQDDTLVGILNETNVAIPQVALSSNTDIFGFDGDGICSTSHGNPTYGDWTGQSGCPYGTTGYEGPGTSFNGYAKSTGYKVGNVLFSNGGLAAGSSTFFSLESSLSGASFTVPASFVVTKSASPSSVIAGDTSTPITYTLTATNIGNAAGDVSISDGIPTGTTYVASSAACPATLPGSATCTASESSGHVSYEIADVAGGDSVSVTFQVTANASDETGSITNTAIWSGPGCVAQTSGNTGTTGNTGDDDDEVSAPVASVVTPVTCDTNTTTTTVTAQIPVTVTASNTTSVYGQTTPPTVSPVYSPVVTPATGATCSTTVVATTPVGVDTGSNTCTGAADPRYTFTYAAGNGTVTPAPLTATASSGSVVYGGGASTPALRAHAIPTITATITGFVNDQTSSVVTTQPTCSTTATASSPVGSYPTTCTGGVAPNYTFNYVAGALTVTPAALTITASSGSANIGGTIPAVTAAYSGFVNGDTATSLSTAPTCSTTATSTSPAAVYPTNCTGAVDANYTITYVPGTMSLTAAPATAPATTAAASGTTATTTPTPSTSPAIAFTGAMLAQEWLIGLGALILGAALVLIGRRRRSPKHAAGRE